MHSSRGVPRWRACSLWPWIGKRSRYSVGFGRDRPDGCASVFASEPWGEPWARGKARERLTEIYHAPGFEGFVGVVGGEPVGLAPGNSVSRSVGRGFFLHEFCVKAEVRGVGGRLLESLEGRLRDAGVGSVFLVTGPRAPARGFCFKDGNGEATGMAAMVKTL